MPLAYTCATSPVCWSKNNDRFRDATAPRLVRLAAGDLEDMPGLVAVRQTVERVTGFWRGVERGGKIGWHSSLARRRIELDVDVDLVAAADLGSGAIVCVDAHHEYAAHHGDGAAVGEAIDGDADGWALARSEGGYDILRDLDAGGSAGALDDRGSKSHVECPLADQLSSSVRARAKISVIQVQATTTAAPNARLMVGLWLPDAMPTNPARKAIPVAIE